MLATRFILLVATFGSALAFPQFIPSSQVPGAVRSPCPALNALANHGFLPRNGKNITLAMLEQASIAGLNVGNDFTDLAGSNAFLTTGSIAKGGQVFDLNDINQHNIIEHDASLSRQDAYFGDDHTFNATIYRTLKLSPRNGFHTPSTLGPVRKARLLDSLARNPNITWNAQIKNIAYIEAASLLSVMGNPSTGVAKASWVDSFFEQERLPYELGWTTPRAQTNLTTLSALSSQVLAAANDSSAQTSSTVTVKAIKLAFGA